MPRSSKNTDASSHCFHSILMCIFPADINTRGQLCLWYFFVTSGILTGSLVPSGLLGRATFMTPSQAAKGNITVSNYKGMNVIRTNGFKLKASVDVFTVVTKNQTWPAVESMELLFPRVSSCIGSLLTLGLDSASMCTDHSFQLTEIFALG